MRTTRIVPLIAAGLMLVAAGPAADQAGSSEAETVQRGCSEPASDQYDPPSGEQSSDCYVNDVFDASGTYTATHWTNDVECGTEDQVVPGTEAAGVVVSGSSSDGYLQACSDGDLPINGRATVEGDPAAQEGSVSIDGDKDNQPEQLQGWAKVDLGRQSVSCGQAYSEGGRADAHHPTDNDGQDQCG